MRYLTRNLSHLLLSLALLVLSISLLEPVLSWIQILVFCAFVMRISLYSGLQKHSPSVRTLNLLALLSGLVLAYFSWHLGVLLGMVNLLVMACALKLMQLRNQRDYYQLIASVIFLISCGFIFEQSIAYSLIFAFCAVLTLLSLLTHFSPTIPLARQNKRLLIMSLQAMPIGVLLFFGMPKLTPFWQMPTSKSAETGLTDTLTPGDIANLSQSTELAFRVTFDDQIPVAQERYWRALVMEDFDGKSWKISQQRNQFRRNNYVRNNEFRPGLSGPFYAYEVLAAASNQRWLFALDVAIPDDQRSDNAIWQSHDYQLMSRKLLISNFQYRVKSFTQAKLNFTDVDFDRRLNLTLPQNGNPQTRNWATNLRNSVNSDQDFIRALLTHFQTGDYRYTLKPDLMPIDQIDTFLFDKQAGFCAHYASAMAFALRVVGIPARVVAGYQGGEMRENDYLSVYQYDAHAWIEAWVDDSGWQRFDPTAMVAPDRISLGLQAAVEDEGSFLDNRTFSLAKLKSVAWINAVRLGLADLDYFWSRWVLGFNTQSQQDLFKAILGNLSAERVAALSLSIFAAIGLLLAIFYLPNWHAKKTHPADKIYADAQKLLGGYKIHRPQWQGPLDFAQKVQSFCGEKASQAFMRLSKLYVATQYKKHNSSSVTEAKQIKMMRVELRKLKSALSTSG